MSKQAHIPIWAALLGAGASVEAGIPATVDMTRAIADIVDNDFRAKYDGAAQALHYVRSKIVAYDAVRGGSAYAEVDVERLFSAVQLLADRENLEITPFVGNWDQGVGAIDVPQRSSFWGRNFKEAVFSSFDRDVERLLDQFVREKVGLGSGYVFARLVERMTMALRQVTIVTRPVDYLAPLMALAQRQSFLAVATLNYDLSIEAIARQASIPSTTGIEYWSEHGRWNWPKEGIRLLKLHGSIDWRVETIRPRATPSGVLSSIAVTATDDPVGDHRPPALVFGQRGKLTTPGPFLDLLTQFREEIEQVDRLLVIGYSFRDEHVNEAVRRWINGDRRRHLVVIDPGFTALRSFRRSFQQELLGNLIPLDTPTLTQPYFDPRMTIQRVPASEGLNTLAASWS